MVAWWQRDRRHAASRRTRGGRGGRGPAGGGAGGLRRGRRGTHPYVGHVLGGDLLARLVVVHAVLAVAELDLLLHQLHRLHLDLELAGLSLGGAGRRVDGGQKPEVYMYQGCSRFAARRDGERLGGPYAVPVAARRVARRRTPRAPSQLRRLSGAAPSLPPATWRPAATRTATPDSERRRRDDDRSPLDAQPPHRSDAPSAPATGGT